MNIPSFVLNNLQSVGSWGSILWFKGFIINLNSFLCLNGRVPSLSGHQSQKLTPLFFTCLPVNTSNSKLLESFITYLRNINNLPWFSTVFQLLFPILSPLSCCLHQTLFYVTVPPHKPESPDNSESIRHRFEDCFLNYTCKRK